MTDQRRKFRRDDEIPTSVVKIRDDMGFVAERAPKGGWRWLLEDIGGRLPERGWAWPSDAVKFPVVEVQS